MNIFSFFVSAWWLLVLIGVMILIHELGHFWAARAFDVRVDVFSFGFGPRLFGFRRGETDYRFSLFLFGGYVKMAGENPEEAQSGGPEEFLSKPRWQRLIIAFAGPFMNIVLAIAVLTGLFMVSYEKVVDDNGALIGHVMANSPAAKAGIQPGDSLVSLDGTPLGAWEMFAQSLEERPEDDHVVAWRTRTGENREAHIKLDPRRSIDEYQAESTLWVFGATGARAIEPVPQVSIQPHFTGAVVKAIGRAFSVTGTLVRVLGLTILGKLPSTAIGGPILVYQVAGVAAQHGAEQFLVMAALVSLNLALLNLLPVPLLDGGQATLVIVEAVRRRPVSARTRERATIVGVALLAALLLLASRNDLLRNFLR